MSSDTYLISHKYASGNYGYISYRGTYTDAMRHALLCLGREHGMYGDLPDESKYLVQRYPIYTLRTERVLIELIPYDTVQEE